MQKHRYIQKYLPDVVLIVVFALIITFALYIVGNTYPTEYTVGNTYPTEYTVGNTYPTEYTKQTEATKEEIYFLQNKISEQAYTKAESTTEQYITTETVTEIIDIIVGCGVPDAPPQTMMIPTTTAPETTSAPLPDRYKLTSKERTLIASVAMLEDSDPAAMRSICEVILNRLESDRFPDTVHDVLYQKKQFNVIKRAAKSTPTEEAYAAIDAVFVHGVNVVGGALFFAEKSVKPSRIARGLVLAGEYGDTRFYAQEE